MTINRIRVDRVRYSEIFFLFLLLTVGILEKEKKKNVILETITIHLSNLFEYLQYRFYI